MDWKREGFILGCDRGRQEGENTVVEVGEGKDATSGECVENGRLVNAVERARFGIADATE